MVLPTQKILAQRQNPKRTVIYGPPKVGKTEQLVKLEGLCLVDLENGSDFASGIKIKVNSLKELGEFALAVKEANYPYKYIAYDTITELEKWCEVEATVRYKNSTIGKNFTGNSIIELPNGAGYYWLRETYQEIVEFLCTLAPNIILVGHLKDKFIEKAGKEVQAKDLDLTGKLKSITCAKADAIGYVYRVKNDQGVSELMITFESADEVICGSRCGHLRGKSMKFDWSNIFLPEGK